MGEAKRKKARLEGDDVRARASYMKVWSEMHTTAQYADGLRRTESLILSAIMLHDHRALQHFALQYNALLRILASIDPRIDDTRRMHWAETKRVVARLYQSAVRLRRRIKVRLDADGAAGIDGWIGNAVGAKVNV